MSRDVFARAVDSATKLTVRSALNPILWLCGIVSLPALFSTFWLGPQWWLLVLAYWPVGLAGLGFLYLLIVDPDKLQSETYQLRKMELERTEQKGGTLIIERTEVLDALAEPEPARLVQDGPEAA